MGTWDAGNFDNDSALNFVSGVADGVRQEMAPPEEVEEIELVMAAVAIYKALVAHCHAPPPAATQIGELKDAVLQLYDAQIDELDPDPEFKTQRRGVIEQTFDEFLRLLAN